MISRVGRGSGDPGKRDFFRRSTTVDDQDRLSCRERKFLESSVEARACEIAPGLIAPVVSKEDAILSKLYWIGQGSERSRRDVTEMLRRDEDIDHAEPEAAGREVGAAGPARELDQEMREGRV